MRTRPRTPDSAVVRFTFAALTMAVLVGCGSSTVTTEERDVAKTPDSGVLDTMTPDARPGPDAIHDSGTLPGDDIQDAWTVGEDVAKRKFGAPCLSNDDCDSGWCVGWDEGYVCTDYCIGQTGCPDGWQCKAVMNTGVDGVFVCFPEESHLCQPCASDYECGAGYCVELGGENRCTRPCRADRPCPNAYGCQEVESAATGLTTLQCVPNSGICDCGPINAGVSRSCVARNEFGTCWGSETCDPEQGWVNCTATIPALEDCNGLDDDCNGVPDDGIEPPAEDCEHSVPEIGTCTGEWVCDGPEGWICTAQFPAEETCDYQDNDCDGDVDEGFVDPATGEYSTLHHCGACGRDCENTLPHADEACAITGDGPKCVADTCDEGYYKADDVTCLPLQPSLCLPCVSDDTCIVPGDRCLPLAGGNYCGRDCAPDSIYGTECPDGYICTQPFVELDDVFQCVPRTGTCDCTPATDGLEKSCRNENTHGTCFGVQQCDATEGWSECTAADPLREACDGVDNDCDGLIDEDVAQPANACQTVWEDPDSDAVAVCPGNWVCTGQGPTDGWECFAPEAGQDVCDYRDNDCDGQTDEEFKVPGTDKYAHVEHCGACGNSCVGAIPNATARCDGSQAVPSCVVDTCAPGFYAAGPSFCLPAQDSSCTPCGSDENCPVPGDRCILIDGAGFCARDCGPDNVFGEDEGTCAAGFTCTDDADGDGRHCIPSTDSCTCRRPADAGNSRSCIRTNGYGTCTGLQTCDPALGWSACDATEPGIEVCDGVDNDCDGSIDDGVMEPADPCEATNAEGRCTGEWHCTRFEGTTQWVCDAATPMPESCDYADNNCDGQIDEDFRDPTTGLYGDAENCGLCGFSCAGTILFATEVGCDASQEPAHCFAVDCEPGYYRPADIDNVCVPLNVQDCSPCGEDSHCEGLPGACLPIDQGRFCARDCPNGDECPSDFICADGQCLPQSNSCTCLPVNDGDERTCFVTNPYGTCAGIQTCVQGLRWSDCTAPVPASEVCDGVDNDCNGIIDDSLDPPDQACMRSNAFGTCPGSWVCSMEGDETTWNCNAPDPAADVCDYVDNDCDGTVDEDYRDDVSGLYTDLENCGACGVSCVGAIPYATATCALHEGNARCEVESCAPGYFQAGPLTCLPVSQNLCSPCATDDNCAVPGDRCLEQDGGRYCGQDCGPDNLHDLPEGECPAGYECDDIEPGVRQCVPTTASCTCLPEHDGDTRACVRSNSYGTCFGQEVCGADGWTPCTATEPGEEICDGIDNDCNNYADDVPGRGAECQITNVFGSCPGALDCAAGSTALVCVGNEPGAETCNYQDDDCNGVVDDGFDGLYEICAAGEGACQRYGYRVCSADGTTTECNATPGASQPERCNGIDDDCDGLIDEDWAQLNFPCTVGIGACQRGGVWVCSAGGDEAVCSATAGDPLPEECNGLDDDCDGEVDPPDSIGCLTFYVDNDSDTYGLDGTDVCLCLPDAGHSALTGGDCDDSRFDVNPSATEICNTFDDDCDGQVDENVLSECGNCDSFCSISDIGLGGDEPFTPTVDNSSGLWTDPNSGGLVIDTDHINLTFIWIANSGEDTVSQLNTVTGAEVGRYRVCDNPSRTAVDLQGNMYVGCRNDDKVAKVILDRNLCADKNGNGVIDTSVDLNGDRAITGDEILPYGQDECVAWVVSPLGGDRNAVARAMVVDRFNKPWVGYYNQVSGKGFMMAQLDPETGQVTREITGLGAGIYGLVIDQQGRIWGSGRNGSKLIMVNPESDPVEKRTYTPGGSCRALYGIVVDKFGRVWLGNSQCAYVYRFDPETEQWMTVNVSTSSRGYTRGVAANKDGLVIVGHHQWTCSRGRSVTVIDAATGAVQRNIPLASSGVTGTVGVAFDYQGYVWAINQCTANASKVDPSTGTVILTQKVGSSPYTYSDMTGYNLHVFTAPNGYYRHIVAGWPSRGTRWLSLDVDADIPENTYIDLRLRSASTVGALRSEQWSDFLGPFPPENFPYSLEGSAGTAGDYLELEFWMFSRDSNTTPTVWGIDVEYTAQN